MRVLLAAVIVLMSVGPDCTRALAAVENSDGPARVPPVIPAVTPAPGAATDLIKNLGAGLPVLPTQIGTGEVGFQAIVPGAELVVPGAVQPQVQPEGVEAQAVGPNADAPQIPDAQPAQPEEKKDLLGTLRGAEQTLDKALDKPGASDEQVFDAAKMFQEIKTGPSALGIIGRVTGISPLWNSAARKLSVQKHADILLDPFEPLWRRIEAARKLGELQGRETIEALGETAAHDKDSAVREAAREALEKTSQRWLPVLLRELHLHPLSGRRAASARALGWYARFSSDPELVDALGRQAAVDINQDVRLTAIHALSRAHSLKALATLVDIRRLATTPDIISATEVAIRDAIALQQAAGQTVAPYHPSASEFGSSKQPLYAAALKRVIAVSAIFTAIEFIGGLMIGSLSLKADSMHLMADLGINVGALFALWMSRRPPNSHKTYGYLKMESLTGLLSAVAIAGMALYTLSEAIPRLWAPVAVPGLITMALAASGLLSNAISTVLLRRYQDDNLSIKGAFLHAATDAVGSVGIITAGALIYFFHWFIADPIISFLIVALILHTTWDLAKRSWNVLIDAVPPGIKIDELENDLLAVPGVASVYDLHVWSLNSSEKALTAILYIKPNGNLEHALAAAKAVVRGKHGIGHATLQVEYLKPKPSI